MVYGLGTSGFIDITEEAEEEITNDTLNNQIPLYQFLKLDPKTQSIIEIAFKKAYEKKSMKENRGVR